MSNKFSPPLMLMLILEACHFGVSSKNDTKLSSSATISSSPTVIDSNQDANTLKNSIDLFAVNTILFIIDPNHPPPPLPSTSLDLSAGDGAAVFKALFGAVAAPIRMLFNSCARGCRIRHGGTKHLAEDVAAAKVTTPSPNKSFVANAYDPFEFSRNDGSNINFYEIAADFSLEKDLLPKMQGNNAVMVGSQYNIPQSKITVQRLYDEMPGYGSGSAFGGKQAKMVFFDGRDYIIENHKDVLVVRSLGGLRVKEILDPPPAGELNAKGFIPVGVDTKLLESYVTALAGKSGGFLTSTSWVRPEQKSFIVIQDQINISFKFKGAAYEHLFRVVRGLNLGYARINGQLYMKLPEPELFTSFVLEHQYGLEGFKDRDPFNSDLVFDASSQSTGSRIVRRAGDQRPFIPGLPRRSNEINTVEVTSITGRWRFLFSKAILIGDKFVYSFRNSPERHGRSYAFLQNTIAGDYKITFPKDFASRNMETNPARITIERTSTYNGVLLEDLIANPPTIPDDALADWRNLLGDERIVRRDVAGNGIARELGVYAAAQRARHRPIAPPGSSAVMDLALRKGFVADDFMDYSFYGFALVSNIFEKHGLDPLKFNDTPPPSSEKIMAIIADIKATDNANGALTLIGAHMPEETSRGNLLHYFNNVESKLMYFVRNLQNPFISVEDIRNILKTAACMNDKCTNLNYLLASQIDLEVIYSDKTTLIKGVVTSFNKNLALQRKTSATEADFLSWVATYKIYEIDFNVGSGQAKLTQSEVEAYLKEKKPQFIPNEDYLTPFDMGP